MLACFSQSRSTTFGYCASHPVLCLTTHMNVTELEKKTTTKTEQKDKTKKPTDTTETSCMGSLTSHQFIHKEDAITEVIPLKNLSVKGRGGT